MKKFLISIILIACVIVGSIGGTVMHSLVFSQKSQSISPLAQQLSITPTISAGIPLQLTIPILHVSAHIESIGLDSQNNMDVPKEWFDTGWYNKGPRPGEIGNVVIDGHYDTPTGAPSVFYQLKTLHNGDIIQVTDNMKKTYTYSVTKVINYPTTAFPIEEVFGPTTKSQLNLITCGGTWDKVAHNYRERTVVYSELQ